MDDRTGTVTTVSLRHVADVWTSGVDKHTVEGELPVQLCNYTDAYKRDRVRPGPELMRATATADEIRKNRLRIGDTVFTKDSEDPQDIGISAFVDGEADDFVCGYHLAIARPFEANHPRFLNWALRARPALDHFSARATGISRYGISISDLRAAPVPLVDAEQQRRIADFLDDRVARIDRIIAARREQLKLIRDVPWLEFGVALASAPEIPIRRAVASLADGPFGSAFSSADYVDSGPAVVRLGNIGFAEFRGDDLARVPEAIFTRFPLTHVQPGDLLIASLGDANNHAGRACVAPGTLGPAMVKGKCFRATAEPSVASEAFLAVLLSSPRGADALVQQGTGATRSMLNFDRLLSCRLPIPSRADQQKILEDFLSSKFSAESAAAALTRSIDLLAEYKSSLITSAVTGELNVTTAGSNIPG